MRKLRLTLSGQGRSSDRRFYTVLVLPHSSSRFRKLYVSRGFLACVGLVVAILVSAGLVSPHLFLALQSRSAEIEALDRENAALRQRAAEFEVALSGIAERLDGVEARSGRMASVLGVGDLPSVQAAAGGGTDMPSAAHRTRLYDPELQALESRATSLDRSMEQLDEAFRERMQRLASTPAIMPVQGWFSDGFGWRTDPVTGSRSFHRGIDIVADRGTPIRATADGVVTRATRMADYGKMIDLSHGHGYATRYGHMSEILVKPGQTVRRGDVIGRVGSTGRSTGPHVHYEVFRDGRRVNPWKYLGDRKR